MAKKKSGAKRKKAALTKPPAKPRAVAATPSSSAREFAKLVNTWRAQGGGDCPLTEITFFLGAGFSKSWDLSYPTGPALFEVPQKDRDRLLFVERAAGVTDPHSLHPMEMSDVKQIVYSLDMNAKYPAIRSRYVDDHNIAQSKRDLRAYFATRFQRLVRSDWQWIPDDDHKFTQPVRFTNEQSAIGELFRHAYDLIDGSKGQLQGARFNFITTNYDWLVERFLDMVISEDDSAFLYLYRGITPGQVCGRKPPIPAFAHSLVFNLFKINGGLEIIQNGKEYHFDYRERDFSEAPPILMLPSREQDYMDNYFLSIFPKAVRLLNESRVLVLVGYSLPEEDALLRFIIRQFCEDDADSLTKALFYVDMASEAEQLARLRSVFPFANKTLMTETYSGSFSRWAKEVVSLL